MVFLESDVQTWVTSADPLPLAAKRPSSEHGTLQ